VARDRQPLAEDAQTPGVDAKETAVSNEPSLIDYFANELSRQSDEIVGTWIDWLINRVGLRPARVLPKEAIRDHMPPVVRGIADFLRMPVTAVRSELTGHLRLHAQMRRDQGYDIEELITEYEALSTIVSDRMIRAVEAYPGKADPVEVARLFARLREGLGEISTVTVSLYRQIEAEHRREMTEALKEFAETMAHEVKNPLGSAFAGASMLEHPEVLSREEERAKFIDLIRRGIKRTVDVVEELKIIALAGGSAGEDKWRPLQQAVEAVFGQLSEMAGEKDVLLCVDEPLPDVTLDGTRVELALVNLVSNAIKYSDPDKTERWVRVGCRTTGQDNRWEIRVQDNGLGIPESMQSQVFERHFRAHPEVAEGTGLGLAIAREAVEQRGGKMWFTSEPGRGTTFYFTLPALEAANEPSAAAARS
jgi:signal transduction histidine kinase